MQHVEVVKVTKVFKVSLTGNKNSSEPLPKWLPEGEKIGILGVFPYLCPQIPVATERESIE
jgi:hypothetical protein